MYRYTNNDASGMPYWPADNDEGPSHYAPTWPPHTRPVTAGSSSRNQMNSMGESPYREGHVPVGIASNPGSQWSGTPCPVHSPSVYWASGRPDQALESPFGASVGNPNGLWMAFPMETEAAPPELEQAFPSVQRALPTSQPVPHLWTWPQPPAHPLDSTSTGNYPVHSVRPYSDHGSATGSGGTTHQIPPFQPVIPPGITGTGHSFVPSRPPASSAPNSVQTSTRPTQVASTAPRPRGELWLSSNASTFRCMWRSGGKRCEALIPGDRRSISSHLRYEHNFTCDGQPIKCEWDDCMAGMQRRNVPRHILSRHFEIKVKCPRCSLSLSRADASKKHQDVCTGPKMPAEIEGTEQDQGVYFSSGDGRTA